MVGHSVGQSVARFVRPSVRRAIGRLFGRGRSFCHSVIRWVDRSFGLWVCRSFGRLFGRSVRGLFIRSVGCSFGRSVRALVRPSVRRCISGDRFVKDLRLNLRPRLLQATELVDDAESPVDYEMEVDSFGTLLSFSCNPICPFFLAPNTTHTRTHPTLPFPLSPFHSPHPMSVPVMPRIRFRCCCYQALLRLLYPSQ